MTLARRRQLQRMLADGSTVTEAAAVLGVSRASVYRALAAEGVS